ncbi:hypothetical protein CHM34_12035 [Paludifilum halophilum]|uniref:UPF0033 domain-containing protein n=1 Tax=Paludifilum halophilum TaxID=1642702 RepID=A0A235B4F4_9BACL|nr:hypothetical protein CHM34_12035 [Paludifilum halophilum]
MKADCVIDAKGLSCPMPIVWAKKGIELETGQVMELQSTDKGSFNDFQNWVKQTNRYKKTSGFSFEGESACFSYLLFTRRFIASWTICSVFPSFPFSTSSRIQRSRL